MRRKEMLVGLLAVGMLAGVSAAATASAAAYGEQYTLTAYPSKVAPGGEITVELKSEDPLSPGCDEATSDGFVAPIKLEMTSHTVHSGSGKVITRPGVYQVVVSCQAVGSLTQTFTITGGPTTTSPPPPTTTGKPTPARVTPVGAPDTGGGGTAA
jgi:hypothetical protein